MVSRYKRIGIVGPWIHIKTTYSVLRRANTKLTQSSFDHDELYGRY